MRHELLGLLVQLARRPRPHPPTATSEIRVDPANTEQLRAWDGDEGAYWAAHPDHFERALESYDEAFFAAAAIAVTDRVLDVGCGTGGATRVAARVATAGVALGVDLSSAMLDVARRLASEAGLSNAAFEHADAQIHPFAPASFDLAIGRTSAMFFGDRVAALANIAAALRPGGRLVLLTWQGPAGNEWIRELTGALGAGRDLPTPPPEAPGPFTLADPEVIRSVLTAAGYTDLSIEDRQEPMWFGADAEDAYQLVLGLMGWMLEGLDDDRRAAALHALRTTIDAHETTQGVLYGSAAWIITAARP